jgi:hypothetical protein
MGWEWVGRSAAWRISLAGSAHNTHILLASCLRSSLSPSSPSSPSLFSHLPQRHDGGELREGEPVYFQAALL